jgi:hypothetical protein
VIGRLLKTFLDNSLNGDAHIGTYSGFGGLVVSLLAFGTQVRGFKPG